MEFCEHAKFKTSVEWTNFGKVQHELKTSKNPICFRVPLKWNQGLYETLREMSDQIEQFREKRSQKQPAFRRRKSKKTKSVNWHKTASLPAGERLVLALDLWKNQQLSPAVIFTCGEIKSWKNNAISWQHLADEQHASFFSTVTCTYTST